jgi:ubiquitin C-terminal hydrolase
LESFFHPEDREVKCEKCDEGQIATQTLKILSKPKALLLHLKRFIVVEKQVADENQPNGNSSIMEVVLQKNRVSIGFVDFYFKMMRHQFVSFTTLFILF